MAVPTLLFLTACAQAGSPAWPQALRQPTASGDAEWPRVDVPHTSTSVRMPPWYEPVGYQWEAPENQTISISWRPHRIPSAQGVAAGSACEVRLAERNIRLSYQAEFGEGPRMWYVTIAEWEETAGTDILMVARASTTRQQRDQIRVIRSLERTRSKEAT